MKILISISIILVIVLFSCSRNGTSEDGIVLNSFDNWVENQLKLDKGLISKIDTIENNRIKVEFFKDDLPVGEYRCYDEIGKLVLKGIHFSGEKYDYQYVYDSLNKLVSIKGFVNEAPNGYYLQEYVKFDSAGCVDGPNSFYVDLTLNKYSSGKEQIIINPLGQAAEADSLSVFLDFFQNNHLVKIDSVFISNGQLEYNIDEEVVWNKFAIRMKFFKVVEYEGELHELEREVYRVLKIEQDFFKL